MAIPTRDDFLCFLRGDIDNRPIQCHRPRIHEYVCRASAIHARVGDGAAATGVDSNKEASVVEEDAHLRSVV
jgi:hypothetical protein